MAIKIVQAGLDDSELELANWLANEVGEYRDITDFNGKLKQKLAFIPTYDLDDLKDKLEACDTDWFTDGTMKLEYNGSDLVFDVLPICRRFEIEPDWLVDDES